MISSHFLFLYFVFILTINTRINLKLTFFQRFLLSSEYLPTLIITSEPISSDDDGETLLLLLPKVCKVNRFPTKFSGYQPTTKKEQFQFCDALFKDWLLLRRVGADAAKEQSLWQVHLSKWHNLPLISQLGTEAASGVLSLSTTTLPAVLGSVCVCICTHLPCTKLSKPSKRSSHIISSDSSSVCPFCHSQCNEALCV